MTREKQKQQRLEAFDKRAEDSDLGKKQVAKMRTSLETEMDTAASLVDNRHGVEKKDDFERLSDQVAFDEYRNGAMNRNLLSYPSMDKFEEPADDEEPEEDSEQDVYAGLDDGDDDEEDTEE
jgi:uncharacterized protein YqgV (UPF0045/DUF77 family)